MDENTTSTSPFRVRKFFSFLLKYWWVPLLTLTLTLGAAIGYLLRQPPTFVSSAWMWETVRMRLPEGSLFSEDLQNFIGTQTGLLKSEKLRELALARLRVSSTNAVPLGDDGRPLEVRLSVIPSPKSTVFRVEAASPNPIYVRAYLQALLNEYLQYKKDIRKMVSGDTLASISEQVVRLERELKAEQDALTAFQRTNNLVILQEEGNIAGSYLARLGTQLSDYKLELKLLEAAALEQNANDPGKPDAGALVFDPLRGTGSASFPATMARQAAFREAEILKLQREKLSRFLRPKHPKIVRLDGDIERVQKLSEIFHNQSREQLNAARQALNMRLDGVQISIQEWQVKAVDANARIAEAERLKLNVHRVQTLYDRLVGLLQNVDISRNIDQDTLAILDPPSQALRSYKQDFSLLGLAIFAGLAGGLAIVFLVAVRDDRFNSLTEVNEKFGDVILGQVPEVPKIRGKSPLLLIETEDERRMYAESYRNLRSAIFFMATEGARPKILLITSALPNEGKSTIAANLARTMALGGSRVLLVDADLRKGFLHELMGMQREPGLSDLLRQPSDLDKIIQLNSLPNLAFISRGSNLNNPGDLFLSPVLDQVFERLRQQFDYVLIDTSPVFSADDATTLAPKVDGTLFVVRRRFSRAGPVRDALELLIRRQANVVGLIFNRADASANSYHYYKDADYYQPSLKKA